jgi:ribosomal protein S18 acetylase RimI-like enzyme
MPIRPFRLPADFDTLLEVIPRAFQYPEHPEWGVQQDDMENMQDTMKMAQRIWPILSVLGAFAPDLREILAGFVWEEGGAVVGLANVSRQGRARRGYIANVAVLPEQRRKGIARKLVEACIAHARQRGDKTVTLDVIAENLPALQLYEKLGFETFATRTDLEFAGGVIPDVPPDLPVGYTFRLLAPNDWRARYALDQVVQPASAQRYQPVEVAAYRPSLVIRTITTLITNASTKTTQFAIYHDATLVARGRCSARIKPGGSNSLNLTLHPDHAALAGWLVSYGLAQIITQSPGRRIHLTLPSWQQPLIDAAQAAGFTVTTRMVTMGMAL